MSKQIIWDPTVATPEDDVLFAEWDEAKEEAALTEAALACDVPCILLNGGTMCAGKFPDGTVIRSPMTFTVEQLESITATEESTVDQLMGLLEIMGNKKTAKALRKQPLTSVVIYAEKYFTLFQKVAQASMGKYVA